MGIDAYVHLRVRDREKLREALEAHAARDRKRWADDGREDAYEALLADGYDPTPLMRPGDDGSVSVFTGMRFGDADVEFTLRCWLHEHFGDALAAIHDDPRGVFATPDVCEPRARTYDGVVAELASAGRWIDPRPPTEEEHVERARALDDYIAGMDAVRAAHEQGEEALAAALAKAPDAVRASWEAAAEQQRMLERMTTGGPRRLTLGEGGGVIDEASLLAALGGKGLSLEDLVGSIAGRLGMTDDDPRGHGRIAAVVPPAVRRVLEASPSGGFDVDAVMPLADGSAIVVTTRLGGEDEDFMAQHLAAVVEAAGLDRAAIGPLPFFRESLADELTDAPDLASAVARLGDRAKACHLRTFDEAFAEERQGVKRWLRGVP